AAGSMRDALSLLDQAIAYGSGSVAEAGVRAMLGAVDHSYLYALLDHLAAKDGPGLMAAVEQLGSRGVGADAALQELAALLHKIALKQSVPEAVGADHPQGADIARLAAALGPEEVQLYYQIALHGRRDLALAPDEFAGLSMTMLRMLAFAPDSRAPARSVSATPTPVAQPVRHETAQAMPVAPPPTVEAAPPPAAVQAPPSKPEPMDDGPAPRPPWEETEAVPAPMSEAPPMAPVESEESARTFDGNWPALVLKLKLGGLAGMLAQHAELVRFENGVFELAVPDAHKVVAGPDYRERLTQALSNYFGSAVTVRVQVGGEMDATPAAQQTRTRLAGIAAATESINADPFVQTLIADFGATVLPDSIHPRTDGV
ncbi:MAG: DNA polymerase III subunit gamma/tau, partial [Burkholderiales bacterium]|nr:DNA polymerase III subunit gamma/tau [Burkholderiales bacterium]